MKLFARTDVGQIREHNEDNFLVADLTAQDARAARGQPHRRRRAARGALRGVRRHGRRRGGRDRQPARGRHRLRADGRRPRRRVARCSATISRGAWCAPSRPPACASSRRPSSIARAAAWAPRSPPPRWSTTTSSSPRSATRAATSCARGSSCSSRATSRSSTSSSRPASSPRRRPRPSSTTTSSCRRSARPTPCRSTSRTASSAAATSLLLCSDGLSGMVRFDDIREVAAHDRRAHRRVQAAHRARQPGRRPRQHHGHRRPVRRRGPEAAHARHRAAQVPQVHAPRGDRRTTPCPHRMIPVMASPPPVMSNVARSGVERAAGPLVDHGLRRGRRQPSCRPCRRARPCLRVGRHARSTKRNASRSPERTCRRGWSWCSSWASFSSWRGRPSSSCGDLQRVPGHPVVADRWPAPPPLPPRALSVSPRPARATAIQAQAAGRPLPIAIAHRPARASPPLRPTHRAPSRSRGQEQQERRRIAHVQPPASRPRCSASASRPSALKDSASPAHPSTTSGAISRNRWNCSRAFSY